MFNENVVMKAKMTSLFKRLLAEVGRNEMLSMGYTLQK